MSRPKNAYALLANLIIISTLFTVLPAKSTSAQGPSFEQVDKDRIDAYIQARMQTVSIPGLALGVIQDGKIVYLKGYGIAGPDGRAVTPQTPFILGSTSKSFTALAVMQLVEAGKIDLEAPVRTYLPWFRTSDAAASAKITVRNLLNQNSGLPAYEGRRGIKDNDQSGPALENGVRELSGVQLSQAAGQGYEYANENYDILGLIVQNVSGKSYEDYVRSAIFAPLRMSHSAAALSDPAADDVATGYRQWLFWSVPFAAPYPRRATPSGFLMSSAEDMAHYLSAQLNGGLYGNNQLLSPQGIHTLHTAGSKMGPSSSYGMGWVIQGQPGATELWHNGDTSNFHSNLMLLPDQRIGIVVLMNLGKAYNNNSINIAIEGVAAILLGKNLDERTDPPVTVMTQMLILAALVIPTLWIIWSYIDIKRWQRRGELPIRGTRLLWRLYLPLMIDISPVGIAWCMFPARFGTPMGTIAVFVPDAFAIIVVLTVLCFGWAMGRIYLTLHHGHFVVPASV